MVNNESFQFVQNTLWPKFFASKQPNHFVQLRFRPKIFRLKSRNSNLSYSNHWNKTIRTLFRQKSSLQNNQFYFVQNTFWPKIFASKFKSKPSILKPEKITGRTLFRQKYSLQKIKITAYSVSLNKEHIQNGKIDAYPPKSSKSCYF